VTDVRINRGLERLLERRRTILASGRQSLGWKAAFGAPAFLDRFGLGGPVVGFMTDASLTPDGTTVDISTWAHAVAEPEVAAFIGQDLPGGSDEEQALSAVASIGPAIELADIDLPLEDLEEILAGNIFHRAVILGAPDPERAGANLTGLEARVRLGHAEIARTGALEDLTGRVAGVISHLSHLLAGQGEMIRAGEVVICGSVVPPIDLIPGTSIEFELLPLHPISVQVAPPAETVTL